MKKSKFKCYAGNPLYDGDKIAHPNGDTAIVTYDHAKRDNEVGRWRAVYADGTSLWLGNQVSEKGQAIKVLSE